jgi:hypothetical protein
MSFSVVLIFLGVLTGAYQFFAIDTYGVTLVDIGILIFFAAAAKRLLWDGAEIVIKRSIPMMLMFAMLGFVLISGINPLTSGDTPTQIQYLKSGFHFIYLWLVGFICAVLPIEHTVWKRGFQSWMLLAIPINIFGVYQIIARAFDLPFAWLDITNMAFAMRGKDVADVGQLSLRYEGFFRATSIFSEPSALAGYNAVILMGLFVPYIRKIPPFFTSGLLRKIILMCTLVGIFLTFSLTGVAIIIAMLAFAMIFERSVNVIKLVKIAAVAVCILVITDVVVENYSSVSVSSLFTKRVSGIISVFSGRTDETTMGESFFYRADNMSAGVKVWMLRPFTGVGIGCMYNYTKDSERAFTDSTVFQALADTGIGGMLSIIGLCIATLVLLYRITKTSRFAQLSGDIVLMTAFLVYLEVYVIVGMFTTNSLISIMLWLEWGMMTALIHSFNEEYLSFRFRLVRIPIKEILSAYTTVGTR